MSRGNPLAKLMVIGEAPGAEEDKLGQPFVGRSGKKLDYLLESVGINPNEEAFFCNVVKFRPPKNRRPTRSEILACLPWLLQQIKLVKPLVIVLAGSTAVQALLEIKEGISKLRGKWFSFEGRLVMPIFHPAYLLRHPSKTEGSPIDLTFRDLLEVRNKLNTQGFPN